MKYGCNMTAAQSIKELEAIKYGLSRHAPEGSVVAMQDRVARDAGIDFAIDVLQDRIVHPPTDWAPCAEGLPKEYGTYWVAVDPSTVVTGDHPYEVYACYFGKELGWETTRFYHKVVAWKPKNGNQSPWSADETTGKVDHIVDANKKDDDEFMRKAIYDQLHPNGIVSALKPAYETLQSVDDTYGMNAVKTAADRLESQEREIERLNLELAGDAEEQDLATEHVISDIAALTARAEQAERAIEDIEYDYNHDMICNQCESGNNASCHHTAAFYGCGFKYDRRGLLPQDGEGV